MKDWNLFYVGIIGSNSFENNNVRKIIYKFAILEKFAKDSKVFEILLPVSNLNTYNDYLNMVYLSIFLTYPLNSKIIG